MEIILISLIYFFGIVGQPTAPLYDIREALWRYNDFLSCVEVNGRVMVAYGNKSNRRATFGVVYDPSWGVSCGDPAFNFETK